MGNKQATKTFTELTDKQIALLKANTKYSDEEIQKCHEDFIRDCPSGRLDKKVFVDIYRNLYPNSKPENYCKYAFSTFDTNHDGSVDFSEFLLAKAAGSQGDINHRLKVAFKIYDISKDGQIDIKELTQVLRAMYDLVGEVDRTGDRDPKKRAATIMEQLDVNGNKKLNKAEFIAGCKNDAVIRKLLAPNS